MLGPTKQQVQNMRQEIAKLRTGGDDAFAQAWLVWAQVRLHTLDTVVPSTAAVEKSLPLVYVLSRTTGFPRETILNHLNGSLVKRLWKAKIEDRDLELEDGYAAMAMVQSALKKGD